ncbi:hypothetical protein MOTC310_17220 [Methylobacterium oryzae]|uniref:Uncharacterized protein n=2 Tax=Methylobacterium oryzae TaxID=334852 RepID=A0ABU7TR70_9HYPH
MVPLSDGPGIADIRAGLASAARGADASPLAQAFRAWVLGIADPMVELAKGAAMALGSPGARSAGHVAILGYASTDPRLAEVFSVPFRDGVVWLGSRSWFRPHQPPTLEADGPSALGLALGVRRLLDLRDAEWLGVLVVRGASAAGLSDFNRSLMTAAAHILEAPARRDLAAMLPEARVALAELGVVPADPDCRRPAWSNALRFEPAMGGPAHASIALRAFDALCETNMPARLGRLEPDDVLRVLQGVERSLRLWTWEERPRTTKSRLVRWEIESEYHVQNMLWAILAPLFPDLNAEEYTPPVGHKNPRMDLTVPSLGLVIEVKFVRPVVSFAKVVEEIAADAALYRVDPRWRVLIPFVWDDTFRTEEHPKLIEGLRKLEMVHDAVVVSRPGKMARDDRARARPGRTETGRRSPTRASATTGTPPSTFSAETASLVSIKETE